MKYILLLVFTAIELSCFCQLKNIDLLLTKRDNEVIKYFDSLNGLKNNPYYKIKQDVSDDGDLILSVGYW